MLDLLLGLVVLNIWLTVGLVVAHRPRANEELVAGLTAVLWPLCLLGWLPVTRRGR